MNKKVDAKAWIKFLVAIMAIIWYFNSVLTYTDIPGGEAVSVVFGIVTCAIMLFIIMVAMQSFGLAEFKINHDYKPK